MSRFLLTVALLAALAPPALAGKVYVEVDNTKPGRIMITVAADGTVTADPTIVIVPGTAPVPPTPPPTPAILTERAKAIKVLSEKVVGDPDREGTANGLALLYRELSKLIKEGKVKDQVTLGEGLKVGADTFLSSRGSGVATLWEPVRQELRKQQTALAVKLAPLADYATLLDEVADGLEASAPNRQISPELQQLIMMIIQIILKLLFPT